MNTYRNYGYLLGAKDNSSASFSTLRTHAEITRFFDGLDLHGTRPSAGAQVAAGFGRARQ